MSGHDSWSWGCSHCKGEEYSDQDWKRPVRGCEGRDVDSLYFPFDRSLRQCPWAVIEAQAWSLLAWYSDWKDLQILPEGGQDLQEQPAYVVEAIRICHNAVRSIESEEQQRRIKEQERQAASALKAARKGR